MVNSFVSNKKFRNFGQTPKKLLVLGVDRTIHGLSQTRETFTRVV
jgi:hypothetical protein